MLTDYIKQMKIALILLIVFTLLTGLIYPIIVTAIAQILFPWQVNGSFITQQNKIVGSQWIGQSFTTNRYFWGRPSATTAFPYDSLNSSGSNLGPSNPDFLKTVKNRVLVLHQADPNNSLPIPVDLVTASGSGLDPDISPYAVLYQVSRVAKARGLDEKQLRKLVEDNTIPRTFGILGEPRINILLLNLALDNLEKQNHA